MIEGKMTKTMIATYWNGYLDAIENVIKTIKKF